MMHTFTIPYNLAVIYCEKIMGYNKGDTYEQEIFERLAAKNLIVIDSTRGGSGNLADIKFLHNFQEINLEVNQIGLFGKLTKLNTKLRHLDRVEIYRPLIADPKEMRRQRAAYGKVMKRGGVEQGGGEQAE